MSTVLSAADITAKMANVKKRGVHPDTVKRFINSGEMYLIVNELASYSAFTPEDLKTKCKQGLKVAYDSVKTKNLQAGNSNTPVITVMFDDDDNNLYLINEDVHAAQQAIETAAE